MPDRRSHKEPGPEDPTLPMSRVVPPRPPPAALAAARAEAAGHAREGRLLRALELGARLREVDPGFDETEKTIVDLYARRAPAVSPPPVRVPPIPLFSDLGPAAFVAVTRSLRVHRFRAGQTIVREGDDAGSMFAIVQGSVAIERLERGAPVCLATMGEGDFFGEMALLSDAPRLATVRAREEAALLEVMRDRIGQITAEHPSVGRVLERFYRRRLVINVLRSNPMLQPLFQRSLDELMASFRSRAVEPGTSLLKQGQRGSGFYILLRGECTVSRADARGARQTIAKLREGDVFGEISLLLGRPVTADVIASTPSFVLRLGKEAFDAAVARSPEVRAALAAIGERRLEALGESSRPMYNV